MAKTIGIARATKAAVKENDREAVKKLALDSFQNFQAKFGMQTDNMMASGTYGFNPVTINRTLLEWIHRGSWIGGLAVDVVADDMTRAGIEINSTMDPDDVEQIQGALNELGVWEALNDNSKWARLYGGSVAVHLIDGQNFMTPLNPDRIGKGMYRGMLVLDRWQLEASTEVVADYGPNMGMPLYYTVSNNAPGLRGQKIHYSRLIRQDGIRLPYQQRLTLNMWGLSVIERLYDRLIAFDSATFGMAQTVFKSYLRTMSIDGMRDNISTGGTPGQPNSMVDGLVRYMQMVAHFQSLEGITLIDAADKLEVSTHGDFSGLGEAILQLAQQVSGALQIPLVRLLGQSPAGLNSTGESDLRTYYDGINQQQNRYLKLGMLTTIRMIGRSIGVSIPSGFNFKFRPLWQLTEKDKADVAKVTTDTVSAALADGLVSQQTAMKELRQSSQITGIWTNISNEDIEAADSEIPDPSEMGAEPLLPEPDGTNENGDPDGAVAGAPKESTGATPNTRRNLKVVEGA